MNLNIGHIYSIIILSMGAVAMVLAIIELSPRNRRQNINVRFGAVCIMSAIWSYGFGAMYMSRVPFNAYICRSFGLVGVFGFLIGTQILLFYFLDLKKRIKYVVYVFFALGCILYFFLIRPGQATYYLTDGGMTYVFKSGLVNNLYTVYSAVMAINILVSTIHMIRRAKTQKDRVIGKKIIILLAIAVVGMLLDTVAPLLGKVPFPGSTLMQAIGTFFFYFAVKDYDRALITEENMSQFVYESVAEPVMVFDSEGRLAVINESVKESFPRAGQEKLGQIKIDEIFELEDNYLEFQGSHRVDRSVGRNNGMKVQLDTNRILDKYGDTIGYIVTIQDMTQIEQAMDDLAEAKQAAESANRAKSVFLANMSHEIRTPLNAIIGFSEILMNDNLTEEQESQIQDIRSSSYNLLAIINDLLDISKIESGKMELVEGEYRAGEMLKSVCLITKTLADKKSLHFDVSIAENIPAKLYGDEIRVKSILVNILNNAVKYTQKGSVHFKVSLEKKEGKTAYLQFSVSDTGVGIKAEDLDNLFDSYVQLDKKKNSGIEGTGLGLAIVKGYASLMGGTVDVESEYGKGSTFIVRIPQTAIGTKTVGVFHYDAVTAGTKSMAGAVDLGGIRILVVDDNAINRKVVLTGLKGRNCTMDSAASGKQAISLCLEHQYDLIFMDQMMPEMDGTQAMHEIRKISDHYAAGGGCQIVALTANAVVGVREELLQEGFDEYLSKPIDFGRMNEMFSTFIAGGKLRLQRVAEIGAGRMARSIPQKERVEEAGEKRASSLPGKLGSGITETDTAMGVEGCNGDEALYLEVLGMLVEKVDEQLEELEKYKAQNDISNYVILVHAMKNQCYTAGNRAVGDLAKELEFAGKRADIDYIREKDKEFQDAYRELAVVLSRVLK